MWVFGKPRWGEWRVSDCFSQIGVVGVVNNRRKVVPCLFGVMCFSEHRAASGPTWAGLLARKEWCTWYGAFERWK